MILDKVTIIGTGLIGGSLGLALCQRGLARQVTGCDRDMDGLTRALECGAVHRIEPDPGKAVANARLVILATPVGTTIPVLNKIAPYLAPGALVTDVGSTKDEIVRTTADIMPPATVFIGGHPMAGSERAGIGGADPYLFENAYYIITPSPTTPGWAIELIDGLIRGIGARMINMTPAEHDRAVAAVSHLPHLVAATLVNTLASVPDGERFIPLAAGGFRDTTRIAAGNPLMWRDIFLGNRNLLLSAIGDFRRQLDIMESAITENNGEDIISLLEAAREVRQTVPAKTKGYLPVLHEIIVTVPDQPGIIAKIAGLLGKEGINITDIEILRVREGQGGTMRLAFAQQWEQQLAVSLLRSENIKVKVNEPGP